MSMRAYRHKLFALETQVDLMMKDCWNRAWQGLSYTEQEQLLLLFEQHGREVKTVSVDTVPAMERPAWATPAQWAAVQRYAEFYAHAYALEMGRYEPI